MQANLLCLTLVDPHAYYYPIPVMKPQLSSRRIDDPRLIAACKCGAEYQTEYSASIETHTATSIEVPIKNRSTITRKNRSIVVQTIGRMTTTIPPWRCTLLPCIKRKACGEGTRFSHFFMRATRPSIDIDVPSSIDRCQSLEKEPITVVAQGDWEEKDEYGVYKDDHGHARDVDGHIIRVSKDDIRSLLERASMDEHTFVF
ncbi:hypothetical protein F2Q69_00006827 [Brassica cretica]|uniref:Uncharacterized protein n=1 Tax=Brassica cretica TaxID=69181 RepID=A0A8S9P2D7_BRACR|nr:hypothetical protein F2Q69_00006827 [Brassica cretica]